MKLADGLPAPRDALGRLWWVALALYLWLLPVGHTTAGRNLALALLLAATVARLWRGELHLRLPLVLPWLAYAAVAMLSLAYAADPAYSRSEIKVEVLFPLLAFMVAASGIRSDRDIGGLAAILVAGNVFLVGWNLAVGVGGGSTKDGLVGTIGTGVGNFSTYVVTVVPLLAAGAWWCHRQGKRGPALALLVLLLANVVALQFTLNRQGFIALLAEFAVLCAWLLRHRFSWRRAAMLLVVAAVVAGALSWQLSERSAIAGAPSLAENIAGDPRWPVWREVAQRLAEQPWTGGGFGQRAFAAVHGVRDQAIWHAHNMVLNKGVQMGIPGVLAFLWLFLAVPWRLRRLGGGGTDDPGLLAMAGVAMAAGVLAKNMTDDFFVRGEAYLFWVLAGALLARLAVPRNRPPAMLVVRRDNIGDLVCTTPVWRALRERFPEARLDALVNSYNRPVLAGNPDIDHLYAYTKAKHREPGETVLGVHLRRLRLLVRLRQTRYDWLILVNSGNAQRSQALVTWVAPAQTLGLAADGRPGHEVERVFRLLAPLGIAGAPPPLRLAAGATDLAATRAFLAAQPGYAPDRPLIAVHISARKASQRWPAERFAETVRRLHAGGAGQFLLLWSPGAEDNPLHPGDDRKAAAILAACAGLPLFAYPTRRLEELIAALALCTRVLCADGGAMHLAAGLGKPIVCLFGSSDAARWRPWGVPQELLQPASRDVADVTVDEVVAAYGRLAAAEDTHAL